MKKEVKNVDKVVIQPLIQKVEVHTTQKEVLPTTKTEVQNSEKIQIQPYIMKEEQHITKKEIAPVTRTETKDIKKRVIQPVIKDVIQPVHIRVKPILQETVKPTIIQGQQIHQAIMQGTQNLPASYQETKYEKEIRGGTSIKTSIVKNDILPVDYRQPQMKPEIVGEVKTTLTNVEQSRTTVRPSIVKTSVLPTIDGGSKVLQTVFGGTTSTIGGNLGTSTIRQVDTTTSLQATGGLTTLGGMTTSQISGAVGSVMGVGGFGDNAVDVTYSTKPNNPFASEVRRVTTTTTTSQYGAGAMNVGGGSVMGVGGGVGDNAADVTYSTKPDQAIVTRLQGVTTSKVLSPIINTTIRPTIVHTTTSTTNPV